MPLTLHPDMVSRKALAAGLAMVSRKCTAAGLDMVSRKALAAGFGRENAACLHRRLAPLPLKVSGTWALAHGFCRNNRTLRPPNGFSGKTS